MTNDLVADTAKISRALAKQAYVDRRIRLIDPSMEGFSHITSTRAGLYAVAPEGWKRLCYGMFFGLVCRPNAFFVFEACDLPRERTAMGRVLRFDRSDAGISNGHILVEGLDNGCHQMEMIGDQLILTDTYNQRLIVVPAAGGAAQTVHPLPRARLNDWSGGYHHVNSILPVADQVLLLLHNGADEDRRSEIRAFDLQWRQVWSKQLPGPGCHDLALDSFGALVCCNSLAGAVITSDGRTNQVSDMMTRGLSVASDGIVVGSTEFARRHNRGGARGLVSFLSANLKQQTDLTLPSGPTVIRRWDGTDQPAPDAARLYPAKLHFRSATSVTAVDGTVGAIQTDRS